MEPDPPTTESRPPAISTAPPTPESHAPAPDAPLRHDRDFVLLWTAGTISVLGTLVTRTALPFTAILVLDAGPIEVSILRSLELIAGLVVGLVAGVWVDRIRRRPILVAADLGRAILLASIPIAALGGFLGLPQLFVVAFLASALTTTFDVAERAYLPTLVAPERLLGANSTLTATLSVAEVAGFSIGGFLVQLVTAPIAIAADAVSYLVSAVFIGAIRRPEPARPPVADREPALAEIRAGLTLIARTPVLRAFAVATAFAHLLWGVFGANWILFATRELALGPAALGIIAGLGGIGSLCGAVLVPRLSGRLGVGRSLLVALTAFVLGNALIPLAPAGAPLAAAAFLIGQQLVGDAGATGFEVLGRSVVQASVADRLLGRAAATIRVGELLLMLVGSLAGGLIGEYVGLRYALWLGVGSALVAMAMIWASPMRSLHRIPVRAETPDEALEEMPLTE